MNDWQWQRKKESTFLAKRLLSIVCTNDVLIFGTSITYQHGLKITEYISPFDFKPETIEGKHESAMEA